MQIMSINYIKTENVVDFHQSVDRNTRYSVQLRLGNFTVFNTTAYFYTIILQFAFNDYNI